MNQFQKIFDAQKALFASGVTRTYEWRVDQLDRMARMVRAGSRSRVLCRIAKLLVCHPLDKRAVIRF